MDNPTEPSTTGAEHTAVSRSPDASRLLRQISWMTERQQNACPVTMTIDSRVPSKWRFVDLETGDVWRWRMPDDSTGLGAFIRASVSEVLEDLSWNGE